ncbi:hypothetical protein TrRE_jg2514 [Triparma retinervis]|uniref:TLDc domain-containing protein n=1 Tax=Triparma retinervis TaxID=2557542 RepID=A0A9W7L1J5_9STRA|nr:hypothetical protein TrRE_jg2514 [Triparma retinervis]
MEYRLSDGEVKLIHEAVSAETEHLHPCLVLKLFNPVLPDVLGGSSSFLDTFVPKPKESSVLYYVSKLCHLYSLLVRPAFQPFPSKTRDRTLLEALFTHAVGNGSFDEDRIALVFFSYWGGAVQDQLTKSFSSFLTTSTAIAVDTATTIASPANDPLSTFLSSSDGSSFHRYCAKLEGYDQPTLTVIDLNCGVEIGVYSTSLYKEAPGFESPASPSFIFTTHPHFTVYLQRERSREPHHQYLNASSRSKNRDNLPHGVGWGGFTSQGEGGFRIFLPENEFMSPKCSPGTANDCRTFLPGPLLPVECMGVGDAVRIRVYGTKNVSSGLLSLNAEAERRNQSVAKARKVDRAAFLDDFKNGVIESKAFAHTSQVDKGRAGEDV